jgi:hypothetical protein
LVWAAVSKGSKKGAQPPRVRSASAADGVHLHTPGKLYGHAARNGRNDLSK